MKYALPIAALAASVAAQGGAFDLAPSEKASGSCQTTFNQMGSSSFTFNTIEVDKEQPPTPALSACGKVVVTLNEGNLVDQFRRTGSIVANKQFQFDGPPQTGVEYSAGWSACAPQDNTAGHLKIGDQEEFYNCYNAATADKEAFYNIYSEEIGNCTQIYLYYTPCTPGSVQAQTLQAGRCGLPPYRLEEPNANLDIPEYPEPCDVSGASASGSSSSSSDSSSSAPETSSASASSTSSMSMSSIPMSGPQDFMTMMTETLAPVSTSAVAAATPAPASNGTSAATGTGVATPTGPTAAPSPFTGAASAVAACKGFVAIIAGAAAFALL